MRTLRKSWRHFAGFMAIGSLTVFTIYACLSAFGQTAPGLKIGNLGSNNFSITITNGNTNSFYYLWWTPFLNNPAYPWQVLIPGNPAQTNFNVNGDATPVAFFRVSIGNGTGVPPWQAADPSDPSSPALTVTINAPTNGAVVQ